MNDRTGNLPVYVRRVPELSEIIPRNGPDGLELVIGDERWARPVRDEGMRTETGVMFNQPQLVCAPGGNTYTISNLRLRS